MLHACALKPLCSADTPVCIPLHMQFIEVVNDLRDGRNMCSFTSGSLFHLYTCSGQYSNVLLYWHKRLYKSELHMSISARIIAQDNTIPENHFSQ